MWRILDKSNLSFSPEIPKLKPVILPGPCRRASCTAGPWRWRARWGCGRACPRWASGRGRARGSGPRTRGSSRSRSGRGPPPRRSSGRAQPEKKCDAMKSWYKSTQAGEEVSSTVFQAIYINTLLLVKASRSLISKLGNVISCLHRCVFVCAHNWNIHFEDWMAKWKHKFVAEGHGREGGTSIKSAAINV